jgi:hypothetical protein
MSDPSFAYQPTTPPVPNPPPAPPSLGVLEQLIGTWKGSGFNTVWRPNHTPGQDRFLELNLTQETLAFTEIPGTIPNRGFLQGDLFMLGVTYLQTIQDANLGSGLHLEPGVVLLIPPTTDPSLPTTLARLASIPHGATILAQGEFTEIAGAPDIPAINIDPFPVGNAASASY